MIYKFILKLSLLCFIVVCMASGCKKYLDVKGDKSLEEPNTLSSLQGIIDLYFWVNAVDVGYSIDGADNFYYSETVYNSISSEQDRNRYIWADENVIPTSISCYTYAFDAIYRANTALEGLGKILRNVENHKEWDNVNGQALFLRAKNYFECAQVWTLAYDKSTSSKDLGMPLRLNTDFNEISVRSTNEETYKQIIKDLMGAIAYLPTRSVHPYRASKPAAMGLLARVYLSMREYDSSYYYANEALKFNNTLLDYNTLDSTKKYPFSQFNIEVIMANTLFGSSMSKKKVDTLLLGMYNDNDLRKSLFFNKNSDGSFKFRGSYSGKSNAFGGVATDELYLMRAECAARLGDISGAKRDMDKLLVKRYKLDSYISPGSTDSGFVLKWILNERRKELIFRALRWTDIKRLNKEDANITLKRVLGNETFILEPNDPHYAMAFPDDVIEISGMVQNPR